MESSQYVPFLLEELRQLFASTTTATGVIGNDDTFVGVGGDSIAGTLCLIEIQERFDVAIDLEWLLDDATTLQKLAEQIQELRAAD